MYGVGSSPTVTNCTFSDNEADFGGGMYYHSASPKVENCTFTGNSGTWGGGMYNYSGSPTVENCTFTGNSGTWGGGMRNATGSSAAVTNCTFSGNTATWGGGMKTDGSLAAVNCIFTGNSATWGGGTNNGGGSSATVTNCVLWSNSPDEISGSGTPTVSYSDVQGGFPGPGNIDVDPLFVDPNNGDLRLSPGSPCIDAGDNTAVPDGVITDLDGNPGFLEIPETPDTGYGDPPIVDMGAYESLGGGCLAITGQEVICHGDGTTFTVNAEGLDACTGGTTMVTFTGSGGAVGEDFCATLIVNTEGSGFCCSTQLCVPVPDCSGSILIGDLDGDGVVGVLDFLALLSAWGPNPNHPADLDLNGEVGVTDLLILLSDWT
jgi:hypothetical protein